MIQTITNNNDSLANFTGAPVESKLQPDAVLSTMTLDVVVVILETDQTREVLAKVEAPGDGR